MKIAIIGADGQLGTDLLKLAPQAVALTIKDIDITDPAKSRQVLTAIKPAIVINTAAYHRVDDCEDNRDLAFKVNADGPANLAKICRDLDAELVHISTDYVFDGEKGAPYLESDQPNPTSVYGRSKLAGEENVAAAWEKHYLIRTCGLYGTAGSLGKGGGNFVETMITRGKSGQPLRVVNDEIVGPTYSLDLARKILQIIEKKSYGLYHITNSGECSWYEFTLKIFELLGIKTPVMPVSGAEFKAKAKRPGYSVLAHEHLKVLGLDDLRSWPDALKAYLQEKRYL